MDEPTGSSAGSNGPVRHEVVELGPVVSAAFDSMPGGVLAWSYPALALSVPGVLLLIAVMAQALGAFAWIPVVRRALRGIGVGDRRRSIRRD